MGFFKKKKSQPTPRPSESLPQEDLPVETVQADRLDRLADEAHQRGEIDLAIESYEKSLATLERFGSAYNGLLNLYNVKLSESAHAKDNAAIQHWTTKLDQLMDLSKRIMRSNY